ncbi:phage major capsid protein [Microbulbifer discodermiae]|uniref:phage major capsid protein n=1 Tax=Microbulbifer sp. 2201CG32-9 TaxID=3232309 RepID=UPI00345B6F35
MSKLIEMQQKRAKLAAQMRSLVDNVDAAKGMTDDQEAQWKQMNEDLHALDKQIEQLEQMNAIEARLGEIDSPARRPEPESNTPANPATPLASAEYLSGFDGYVRGGLGADIQAALTVGTDTDGGYLVPDSWANTLIDLLTDAVFMRSLATVTKTKSTKNLPLTTDKGAAGWVDEGGAYPESDIAFGNGVLEAWKLGRIIKVSEELLEDNTFNLEGEIGRIFSETFGLAEETAFISGDGVKKPTGLLVSGELGKQVASAAAITYDDIVDLIHSVRRVYRRRASFITRDGTLGMLRKLKSTDGVPLWQPSLQAGQPDMLLGYRVESTEAMPAVAGSAKTVAFGDLKQYRIGDRGGIVMQRLNEKYADTGHVGFRMRKRTDGKLLVPEAVKYLQQAA